MDPTAHTFNHLAVGTTDPVHGENLSQLNALIHEPHTDADRGPADMAVAVEHPAFISAFRFAEYP